MNVNYSIHFCVNYIQNNIVQQFCLNWNIPPRRERRCLWVSETKTSSTYLGKLKPSSFLKSPGWTWVRESNIRTLRQPWMTEKNARIPPDNHGWQRITNGEDNSEQPSFQWKFLALFDQSWNYVASSWVAVKTLPMMG